MILFVFQGKATIGVTTTLNNHIIFTRSQYYPDLQHYNSSVVITIPGNFGNEDTFINVLVMLSTLLKVANVS